MDALAISANEGRNKLAVSEGAAGSPPFYGESRTAKVVLQHPRLDYREDF